ncbi:hypothetical protein FE391_18915 [Nonomuraea sp. KC401]|uniref:Uncharacterized protein n=1 Tax=Nonomuraea longispora TaxID=1848320 RepID=A0A4R4NCZ8_9ACTN|nr:MULTISPECIES: hypothetical protein [Nonomuraea]NBE97028.1 hypothetical protein [Nonomuraea sp. K271]TDC06845.1 hypothetical protein E1267_15115 [Nonomuraea longispora]TLF71625.1 hypothetical protein FE391_18915 [Nonomuraea sp. KC401]
MKARRTTSGLPRAEGEAAQRRSNPLGAAPGRRSRVRAWPAAGSRTRSAARQRAQMDELRQGIRYRRIFVTLLGVIIAVSAVVVLLGTVGLVAETRSRPLTAAEQNQYKDEEIARRWQAWPATGVFPEEVKYVGLDRAQQYARRVGIAPETDCGKGVDTSVAEVLRSHNCRTMLRATYTDQTAAFVITVGVAVLENEESRVSATDELAKDDRVGVLPVAFPGTVSERFGRDQRQRTGWVGAGPYIVFSTAGYADGRTRAAVPPEEILHSELWPAAKSVGNQIAYFLADPPKVPPCTQGNVC